jgi:hypothetical protein
MLSKFYADTGVFVRRTPPLTTQDNVQATAIVAGDGRVWVALERADKTATIQARSSTTSTAVAGGPTRIRFGADSVWVKNYDRTLSRIDPRTNRAVARTRLGARSFCCGPDYMTVAAGDVWVDIPNEQLVVRIDARRHRLRARIHVPTACGQLAAGAGSLWVADGCSDQILRIDQRTKRIVHRIDTGGGDVYPLAFADGSVWTTTDDLRLLRIDPATS